MPTCIASQRLTLFNLMQGIFRTESSCCHLERHFLVHYSARPLRSALTATYFGRLVSERSYATSIISTSHRDIVPTSAKTATALHTEILNDLTSTEAGKASTKSKSNATAKRFKNSKTKARDSKKTVTNKTLPETINPDKKIRRPQWQLQKEALEKKFAEGWHPRKKLPPDSLDTIRHLHSTKPDVWTTPVLAEQFKVSPEAIRRILKSKWQPTEEERQRREERWTERYRKIYSHMEELGLRRKKGEWTGKVSDARRLGLEEGPLRRMMRKQSGTTVETEVPVSAVDDSTALEEPATSK